MEGGQLLDQLVATLILKFGQAGSEWADYDGDRTEPFAPNKPDDPDVSSEPTTFWKESPLKVWVMDLQWKYPTKDHCLEEDQTNGNRGRRVRHF